MLTILIHLICQWTFRTNVTDAFVINRNHHVHSYPNNRATELFNNFGGGEITALARIDRDFQLTTRSSNRPTGGKAGWTKLILDSDKETNDDNEIIPQQEQNFVYLFEPSTSPSSLLLFLGGAGLGQYPHIAYNELLTRISKRLNAAVITSPYPLGLDHFELSKKSGEKLRKAVAQCEENGYSSMLPKFYLGHSLGSKLLTISLAATGVAQDVQGIGFLNYNNFGFADTLKMVQSFARNMGGAANNPMYGQIFEFAEQAVSMSGLDFTPSPSDTDKIISLKFDESFQKKTRLFVFDKDDLDSSESFINACQGSGPSISKLGGNHLASVYLKFGLNDIELPDEAKMFANEVTGGFQQASFGEEDDLNAAVSEVCNWMIGKEPQQLAESNPQS